MRYHRAGGEGKSQTRDQMFDAIQAGARERASFAHCGAKFLALTGQIWACSLAPNHIRTHRGGRDRVWCWSDGDSLIVLG